MLMTVQIKFYRINEDYGLFSNFAPYPIELRGKVWPTVEHYFQSQKFHGTDNEEMIRLEKSPMKAAIMGRDRSRPIRADWEEIKDQVMREALRAKISQHGVVRRALLATGNAEIIEHTRNDNYWADGGDGSGKNMLGRLLMEIREELRNAATQG
jgi:ribA/ribD-fused uncharacterized protein